VVDGVRELAYDCLYNESTLNEDTRNRNWGHHQVGWLSATWWLLEKCSRLLQAGSHIFRIHVPPTPLPPALHAGAVTEYNRLPV
jgi:hypothetical protein